MFLSLFLLNTPIQLSKRIIDLFLIGKVKGILKSEFCIEEEKILFKMLIRVIIICQKEILEKKYPEVDLLIFNFSNLYRTYVSFWIKR